MDTCLEFLRSHNFHPSVEFDGKLQRFDRNGKKNVAWFIGRKLEVDGLPYLRAKFGDWSSGEKYEWDNAFDLPPEKIKTLKTLKLEADKKDEEEKRARQELVAKKCETLFLSGIERGVTPYLQRKGLTKLYGAKIDPNKIGNLLVPLRDAEGRLWNVQTIFPEKFGDSKIDKCFAEGGKIKGLFHTIGQIFNDGRIFICEGFATGASIHEATNHAVVVSFNAENLPLVAKVIREKYPASQITICADNDQWTRIKGSLVNVGREKANYAASLIDCTKVFPIFKNLSARPTDFNDLHQLEGLQTVKEQILNVPTTKEIAPIMDFTSNGKPKKPTEFKIVTALLNYFEGDLIAQDGELFRWQKTHWVHQGEEEVNKIYRALSTIGGNELSHSQIKSCLEHFMRRVPVSPTNMFQPNPFCANFLNGTLTISKMPGASAYSKSFKEHSPSDFITNVLPYNYEPEKNEVNLRFLEAVDNAFKHDPDKNQKIKALKEVYGGCIIPAFQRLALFVGPPGSGKSTFIIIASKLVSKENLSMVELHEFRGFHMESMLGKLANMVTDIKTNEPIDEAMLKKIEDRIPVRIDRKFKTPVTAWLPALHIFGCNKLPPNYDGESKAFTRRTSIINFRENFAKGFFNKNFANEIFESNPQGVVNFGLEGVEILLSQGGHFTNPESGIKSVEDWQLDYDPVGQFHKELTLGQITGQRKLEAGPEHRIERKLLWKNFCDWHQESFNRPPRFAKQHFYKVWVENYGHHIVVRGVDYFVGVNVTQSEGANF